MIDMIGALEFATNHFEAEYQKAKSDMPFNDWFKMRLESVVARLKGGVTEFCLEDGMVLYADLLTPSSGSTPETGSSGDKG
jgi:hypothetical protein